MRTSTKTTAAIGGTALALVTAGAAYAYWSTTGSGSGSAATGTTQAITIVQTSAVSDLYPGIAQGLSGTFSNPNTFPVQVASVSVAVDPLWASGTCDADDFSLVQPTTANVQAAVNDTTAWTGGSITLLNKAAENQDDCKSLASVPLVYSSN